MNVTPTAVDYWCAVHLARFLGRYRLFDLAIQSAINHNVLGGFWFALALFILWVRASGTGGPAKLETQRRMFVVLLGTTIAVLLTLVCADLIAWLPPNRMPGLADRYPAYLTPNPNTNSFPSQSVALYTAVAAGVFSLRRRLGVVLFLVVGLLVALPRMYVGGHYLSDVLAGLALGLGGFTIARWVDHRVPPQWLRAVDQAKSSRGVKDFVVFLWILQVAVECRDAVWLARVTQLVLHRLL